MTFTHYQFPAVLANTDNGVHVSFPNLPDCRTFGETYDVAVFMAKDALEMHLGKLKSSAFDIPAPSSIKKIDVSGGSYVKMIDVWV